MKTTYPYHIEEASPVDASLLSAIAWQSKQHWGYPDDWMDLWRKDLTLTPDLIIAGHCCKAVVDGTVAGYALISHLGEGYEIEHCFVLPTFIGKGCGTALLRYMLSQPKYHGAQFDVLADPNAVSFYEKLGFVTVGQVPSQPEGRTLPLMQMVNNP